MDACSRGNFEIVKLLLQHNADTNLKNNVSVNIREYREEESRGVRMCNSICRGYSGCSCDWRYSGYYR